MTIIVSGEKKDYPEGTTVQGLIDAEQIDNPLYVTVSVNGDFVRSDGFATTTLKADDEVEFLYFMGGGSL